MHKMLLNYVSIPAWIGTNVISSFPIIRGVLPVSLLTTQGTHAPTMLYHIVLTEPISSAVMTEQHIIGVHTKDLRCNYTDWISAWTSRLNNQPVDVKVPHAPRAVTSPLNVSSWREALSGHPNKALVDFFLSGIYVSWRDNHMCLCTCDKVC